MLTGTYLGVTYTIYQSASGTDAVFLGIAGYGPVGPQTITFDPGVAINNAMALAQGIINLLVNGLGS